MQLALRAGLGGLAWGGFAWLHPGAREEGGLCQGGPFSRRPPVMSDPELCCFGCELGARVVYLCMHLYVSRFLCVYACVQVNMFMNVNPRGQCVSYSTASTFYYEPVSVTEPGTHQFS